MTLKLSQEEKEIKKLTRQQKMLNKAIKIALDHKGKCLSNKYINSIHKMKWQCEYGHIWFSSLNSIKNQKTWCSFCSKNIKYTIRDCVKIAISRGGKCLSSEYINKLTPLKWECHLKHQWNATFDVILRGHWCHDCGRSKPLTIKIAHKIATSRGGKCLSSEYINNRTPLKWECEFKHTWQACLRDIKNGKTWCPFCKLKTQNQIKNILENILNLKSISNYRPDWLKNVNTKKNLEIDIWFPQLKLAIEYDGIQHFEPKNIFGGINGFDKIKKRDKIKNNLIEIALKNKTINNFIRFTCKDKITEKHILLYLKKVNII